MFTQCPECATVFPVSADALSISAGNVRCGACGAVFFAVQSLSDSLDEDGQIPTCFHSDHPPTLSDPGSDAPPIDDLFWPAAPASQQSVSAEPAETSAESAAAGDPNAPSLNDEALALAAGTEPPPLDLTDDEALEREFDRLINEPDPPEDGSQPPTPTAAQEPAPEDTPADQAAPDSHAASGGEAWVAHRYGLTNEAGQRPPPPEDLEEIPPAKAAGPKSSSEGPATPAEEAEESGGASLEGGEETTEPTGPVDEIEPLDPIGPAAAPEPDPDEPLPEVFTRTKAPGKTVDPTDSGLEESAAEASDADIPLSGVAIELAADRAARNRTRSTWLWGLWSGFALLALVGQWFALEHDQLARSETLRPWVTKACRLFNCRIELPSDLSRIQLTSRSIEPHPSVEGALLISATLQNQATFSQPHPVVEITMADLSGRAVAMRRFTPAEYLESPAPDGMVPGHLLPLVFEVIDPGSSAVAFEFNFR